MVTTEINCALNTTILKHVEYGVCGKSDPSKRITCNTKAHTNTRSVDTKRDTDKITAKNYDLVVTASGNCGGKCVRTYITPGGDGVCYVSNRLACTLTRTHTHFSRHFDSPHHNIDGQVKGITTFRHKLLYVEWLFTISICLTLRPFSSWKQKKSIQIDTYSIFTKEHIMESSAHIILKFKHFPQFFC